MSFGFGVSDVLVLTKFIVTTIGNINDAPTEVQELGERVETVEMNLESINVLPSNAAAGNIQNVTRQVKRISDVLGKIKDVVTTYRNAAGWRKALRQAKYGIWEKGEVGGLVIKLEQWTRDLSDSLIIQIWLATNQMRPQIDQIWKTTRQVQKRTSKQDPAEKKDATLRPDSKNTTNNPTIASNQIDMAQSGLERVLQLPLEQDVPITEQIELLLGQAGIRAEFTRALIDVINERRKRLAHPEDIDPISAIGGKNRLESPKGWILVVDDLNEGLSIMAQTYLELVRIRTVNATGEWLFNRVESAGVQVESRFAKRSWKSLSKSKHLRKGGKSPEKAALQVIKDKTSLFESQEKKDIFARVKKHQSRGIDNWHFRKYEYMLCFDKSVFETMTLLAKCCKKQYGGSPSYANLSKIILVRNVPLKSTIAKLDEKETAKLVDNMKKGIYSFLKQAYHWQQPPSSVMDGPFRTKQIVLLKKDIKLDLDEKDTIFDDITSRTGCRVRVTDEKFPDGHLFSITGRPEALPLAISLVKEGFLQDIPALAG